MVKKNNRLYILTVFMAVGALAYSCQDSVKIDVNTPDDNDGVLVNTALTVSDVSYVRGKGSADINWTNPQDEEFNGTTVSYYDPQTQQAVRQVLDKGQNSYSISGLQARHNPYDIYIEVLGKDNQPERALRYSVSCIANVPETFVVSDVVITPDEGEFQVSWTNPDDTEYVVLSCTDAKGSVVINSGNPVELDNPIEEYTITGLTKKAGPYTFKILAYMTDEGFGADYLEKDVDCLPVTPWYEPITEKYGTVHMTLECNKPRAGSNVNSLLDGNPATFLQSDWGNATTEPHWVKMNLNKPLTGKFTFSYQRVPNFSSGGTPTNFSIIASTDGESKEVILETYVPTGPIINNYPPPTLNESVWTTPAEFEVKDVKYVKFSNNRSTNGSYFFYLAEMWLNVTQLVLMDPENED